MINDNEGMDNALEYYINGDNEAYWQWFIKKMEDRWIELGREETEEEEEEEEEEYWGDWTDEDPY